jgi:hypothetical protein
MFFGLFKRTHSRFLRIRHNNKIIEAKILKETSNCYLIRASYEQRFMSRSWVKVEECWVAKQDRRIVDVDNLVDTSEVDNVVHLRHVA